MKTINLPETDYSGMRQFYQEELDKTLKRLQHIQSVLAQLGDTSVVISESLLSTTPTAKADGIGETEKNAPATPKRKYRKRAGRKALWGPIILKRMKQINRPLTYDELTDEIMSFSNLPKEKRLATKQAVINVTFRLRTKEDKIDTFSNGNRIKYLALKTWFDENGVIADVYRRMLPHPTMAAKKRIEAKTGGTKSQKVSSDTTSNATDKPRRGRPPKPVSNVWADPSKRPTKVQPSKSVSTETKTPKPVAAAKPVAVVKPAAKRGRPAKAKKTTSSAPTAPISKLKITKSTKGTKAASKPAPKAIAKPIAKAAVKPAAKAVAKPAIKAAAKPAAKAVSKPVAKAVVKPAIKKVAKPATKPKAKPAAKAVAKPATKKVAKTATKAVAKPATKAAAKPAAKAVAKPAAKRGRPAKKK